MAANKPDLYEDTGYDSKPLTTKEKMWQKQFRLTEGEAKQAILKDFLVYHFVRCVTETPPTESQIYSELETVLPRDKVPKAVLRRYASEYTDRVHADKLAWVTVQCGPYVLTASFQVRPVEATVGTRSECVSTLRVDDVRCRTTWQQVSDFLHSCFGEDIREKSVKAINAKALLYVQQTSGRDSEQCTALKMWDDPPVPTPAPRGEGSPTVMDLLESGPQ